MPATLTVVTLAALLAFGLMATTGAQPAEAQDAPCVTVPNGTADTMPTNGNCEVTSADAIIKFTNDTDEEFTFHVFGKNVGDDDLLAYPPDTTYDSQDDNRFEVQSGVTNAGDPVEAVRYQTVKVVAATVRGASSATLTISGEALSTETVYVFRGDTTPTLVGVDNESAVPMGEAIKQQVPNGSTELTLKFLGPPVHNVPDAGDLNDDGDQDDADEDPDDDPDPRSMLALNQGVSATILDNSTLLIQVTATIQDANGDPLKGKITYTVEYLEGSALGAGRSNYTSQPVDFPGTDNAGTMHNVSGWAADGAVVVMVSAIFTGDTGSLTVPEKPLTLMRAGDLDSVEVIATCYQPGVEEEKATSAQAKICGTVDPNNTPNDASDDIGLRPRTVFKTGQMFTIRADAIDKLGTDTDISLTLDLPDTKTEKGAAAFTATSFTADTAGDDTAVVTIHGEAPAGRYQITVKAKEGSGSNRIDREATVDIVVSGEPEAYSITGPEMIPLAAFASGAYTVSATDAQGNPPNFDDGGNMVLVVIESNHSIRATGLNTENMAILDPETGMKMFTIYKPANAMDGDIASIGIFVDDELQDSIMVSFGEALPEMMAPGMPMNVMAEATSHDMITVSWASPADDGGSDITGYMVQRGYMDADNMMMWMDVDPAHMGMDMDVHGHGSDARDDVLLPASLAMNAA